MVILNLLGGHRNVEFSSFLSIHLYQLLPNFFLTLFFWTSNLSGDWKLGQIVVFFFFFFHSLGGCYGNLQPYPDMPCGDLEPHGWAWSMEHGVLLPSLSYISVCQLLSSLLIVF